MKKIAIAIDGPAAAGKSTIAKKVANHFGYTYIDTGAMYRAFTWYVLEKGVNPQKEEDCNALIPEVNISLTPNYEVFVNGTNVSKAIREPHVSGNVSYIASYREIREALTKQQRLMAEKTSVVMDGRDIGSYVLPNAEVKIFQTATVAVRAKRRCLENEAKGLFVPLEDVIKEIEMRDHIDSTRAAAPLMKTIDAIEIDTDSMTIDEVVNLVIKIVNDKIGA